MSNEGAPRDEGHWAKPVATLTVGDMPAGARNANVTGRRLTGAAAGFGRLWHKTFQIRLDGVDASPEEIVRIWKERFADLWPKGDRFFLPKTGIAPGGVALINADVPGAPTLVTGVLVVYADDTSFCYMAPEGHPFAGPITFSAFDDAGTTVAQVEEYIRASDPLWELGMPLGISRKQNATWVATLEKLAETFGVRGTVESRIVCVDRGRQWRNAGKVWQNAGIRSAVYALGAPVRSLRRRRSRA